MQAISGNRVCGVSECERPHFGHGMCNLHYQRWKTLQRLENPDGGMKPCSTCNETKHVSKFSRHPGTKDGRRPECSKCHAAYHREQRKANPREKYRKQELNKNYGITLDVRDDLFEKQDGKCAICLSPSERAGGRWNILCVDHDHATGKIRGLLCDGCNKGLGHFADNPQRLEQAIKYLLKGRD
jgi:hypothetical protein